MHLGVDFELNCVLRTSCQPDNVNITNLEQGTVQKYSLERKSCPMKSMSIAVWCVDFANFSIFLLESVTCVSLK